MFLDEFWDQTGNLPPPLTHGEDPVVLAAGSLHTGFCSIARHSLRKQHSKVITSRISAAKTIAGHNYAADACINLRFGQQSLCLAPLSSLIPHPNRWLKTIQHRAVRTETVIRIIIFGLRKLEPIAIDSQRTRVQVQPKATPEFTPASDYRKSACN